MLMNRVETALVNSPPRRWLQRYYEVPWMRRLGGPLPPGARVLELGCGPGYGTQLILDRFGAGHVDAIDLDPAMITRARRRLTRRYGQRVRLAQGSATDLHTTLGEPLSRYDAVFDFAIIHHIPIGPTPWPRSPASSPRAGGSTSTKSPPWPWPPLPTGCCSTTRPRTASPPRNSSPSWHATISSSTSST
jgi:SAM-dependent methyltransferase